MATNQDLVDTFEAILASVTTVFTTPYLEERIIDKAQLVQILMNTIPPALDEATKFNLDNELKEAQIAEIECRTAKCQYELKNILPLQATKLQLENRLLKCQGDKCCYELEFILPLEKERLELEKEKLAMERDRLEAEKDKMLCEIAKCQYEVNTYLPANVSEMQSMGTSNRDLNTIKGELYLQQKEGIIDTKQLGLISRLSDLYAITVSEEPSEDVRLNIMNRDSNKGEISEFEKALHSLTEDTESIRLEKTQANVDEPIVSVSNYNSGTDVFTATVNTHPDYNVFQSDTTTGLDTYTKYVPDANGDVNITINGSGGGSLNNTEYRLYATNPQGTLSKIIMGRVV